MKIEALHVGLRIRHPQYGLGTVKTIAEKSAEIRFDDATRTVDPELSGITPAEASVTVSLPSEASAQISQPGTPSISVRSPLRTTAWSSASMTRLTLGRLLVLETIILIPLYLCRVSVSEGGATIGEKP